MAERNQHLNGIIYFTIGTSHLARLAVSIWSLRKHYSGPITVLNAGDDQGIVELLRRDPRLWINVQSITIPRLRKHTAYVAKPSLWRWTPYEKSLFLDADTLVARDPSKILDLDKPLVVTRFSNWVTTGRMYSGRIRQWLNVTHPDMDVRLLAQRCLDSALPAVNTGVFLFDRENPLLPLWESLTAAGAKCSFTDEVAMQLLLPEANVGWLDDRWNASPLHRYCDESLVGIWHFHGTKNLRKEQGKAIWYPAFQECLKEDIGGISNWFQMDKSLRGKEAVDVA